MSILTARTELILNNWEHLRSVMGGQWDSFCREFLQATTTLQANSDQSSLSDVLYALSKLYNEFSETSDLARQAKAQDEIMLVKSPKDPLPEELPNLPLICNRILEKREQLQVGKNEQATNTESGQPAPAPLDVTEPKV